LTKYVDADKKPLELGDFTKGQKVDAVIVFGKLEGIMVEVRANAAKSDEVDGGGGEKPARGGRGGQ
jgi:hypothetical protein